MENNTNKKLEATQKAKQEQASKMDKFAKVLDEDSLDSITGGIRQGSSLGEKVGEIRNL